MVNDMAKSYPNDAGGSMENSTGDFGHVVKQLSGRRLLIFWANEVCYVVEP
jgi:hypothetical protein